MSGNSPGTIRSAITLKSPRPPRIQLSSPSDVDRRISLPSLTTIGAGTPARRRQIRRTFNVAAEKKKSLKRRHDSWDIPAETVDPSNWDTTAEIVSEPNGAEPVDLFPPTSSELFTPLATQSSIATSDQSYAQYVNLLLADCVTFYQISTTLYVVQGWDQKAQEPTVCFELY